MSVSRYELKNRARRYLLISCAVLAAGIVYECFSHQVFSAYMLGAFLIPLLLGALPLSAMAKAHRFLRPDRSSLDLLAAAVATLTVGSLFRGALEIYGTSSHLSAAYRFAGAILLGLAVIRYGFLRIRKAQE